MPHLEKLQGNLRQIRGMALETLGSITGDEDRQIRGKREFILGRFQKRYGLAGGGKNKRPGVGSVRVTWER